jgi:hypothetical protein
MNTLLTVALVIGTIVYIFVKLAQSSDSDSDIRAYLLSRGASDIDVSYSWLDSDHRSQGYVAEYTNAEGKRCRTHYLASRRGGIEWLEPPEV